MLRALSLVGLWFLAKNRGLGAAYFGFTSAHLDSVVRITFFAFGSWRAVTNVASLSSLLLGWFFPEFK